MTHNNDAAREIAQWLANSPDVQLAPQDAHYLQPNRTIDYLGLANAGDLGAPAEAALAAGRSEHDEQVSLFEWAAMNEAAHPELAMLAAIPNGGARHPAVAAQLKAEGVKAGIPDIVLLCKRGRFGALFIELKRPSRKNHATVLQTEWIAQLRLYGYQALVCYGCEEAKQAIMAYLGQEG